MTVTLTDVEIQRVLDACVGYVEIMSTGDDTHEYTIYEMETGLGSALRKICKGKKGQSAYAKYKTISQCPTFEEWRAARTERQG